MNTEDTVILNVRALPREARDRITRAASARGMTLAQYLSALIDLHDAMRARADAGDDALAWELESRGLQTVTA